MKRLLIIPLILIASIAFAFDPPPDKLPQNLVAMGPTGLVVAGGGSGSGDGEGSDDDIYDAQVKFGSGLITANNFKVLLYNNTGTLLATSNAGSPSNSTTVTVTFPSSVTLSNSSDYYVGIIADDYLSICWAASGWTVHYNSSGSYASPPNITPGSDAERSMADMAITIRNASGTVLLGDLDGADCDETEDFTDLATYNDAETY